MLEAKNECFELNKYPKFKTSEDGINWEGVKHEYYLKTFENLVQKHHQAIRSVFKETHST